MLAELVFVTRFLGLVVGEQEVVIDAAQETRKVDLLVDGSRVQSMLTPPWRTVIDFGPELAPHEIEAIAFDESGNELDRDRQVINLAHAEAEVEVSIDHRRDGLVAATANWRHAGAANPTRFEVILDGKTIHSSREPQQVILGRPDESKIHSVSVRMTFADGSTARKDVVTGGIYAEEMPVDLTMIRMRRRGSGSTDRASCFQVDGRPVEARAVDHGRASVDFVFSGAPNKAHENAPARKNRLFALPETDIRITPALPVVVPSGGFQTSVFRSILLSGLDGTGRILQLGPSTAPDARPADAVAAAGVQLLGHDTRRAVVLIIGRELFPDRSTHSPLAVRRYLARIGVPLYVWSSTGPRPDLRESWGEVRDVSSTAKLLTATQELKADLESQDLAWLPVSQTEAFRAKAVDRCAWEPLASVELR